MKTLHGEDFYVEILDFENRFWTFKKYVIWNNL